MSNSNVAPIEEPSYTRKTFCEVEKISLSTFHKLRKLGLAPREWSVPGTKINRITPEARREWHERIAKLQKEKAAQLERERQRRSEQASAAGKIAAASPRHYCRRSTSKRRRSA